MRDAISKLMGDVADPHFQATVEATLTEMASGAGESAPGGHPSLDGHLAASVFNTLAAKSGAAGAESIAKSSCEGGWQSGLSCWGACLRVVLVCV